MTVDILLGTYNGERYLDELLASLQAQSYPHWRVLLRDDGSSDQTVSLLTKFQKCNSHRVKILPPGERGGVVANFSALLMASDASYAMCCDQDDIWDCEKIAISLAAMHKLEAKYGREKPLLIHTDLRVADASLSLLENSFWHYAKLYPYRAISLNRLLVQNVVTGCTMLCNRALLDMAAPIPPDAIMHDWWLALVASAFGALEAIQEATITYRQHNANAIGAQKFGTWAYFQRARSQLQKLSLQKRKQTTAFLTRYDDFLTVDQRNSLHTYLHLHLYNSFKSRYLTLRYGFRKQGFLRQLGALLLLKQP